MHRELLKLLRVIFTPSCWLQNYPFNRNYDKFIRDVLRNPNFTSDRLAYVTARGVHIWVENYPYAYGTNSGVRPSRRTIFWLHDAVEYYKKNGNIKLKVVN